MRTSERSPRPSTISASTAPASTDASWSGSPTSSSRLSGRSASSSRAISVSDTIDVSSTTITSWGNRFSRWWRNRDELSGRDRNSRCSVDAFSSGRRSRSTASSLSTSNCTASSSLAAALPVGAASAIRSGGLPDSDACSASRASSRATVVVLPVPGPPVSTVSDCVRATSAAVRCSSQPLGNRRSRLGTSPGRLDVSSVNTSSHTCCSSSQYRSMYSRSPNSRSTGFSVTSGLACTACSQVVR